MVSVLTAVLAFAGPCRAEDKTKDQDAAKNVEFEQLKTTYRYQDDGTGEIVQGARIRVLTEAGRDEVGQFYFPYASELEDIKIDYFRTVKKDGTTLTVDPAQAVDMASPVSQGAPMFSDLKLKVMVARDLGVGDALEYQFTRVVRLPLKSGDFWALHYQNTANVVDSEEVTLDVPGGRALSIKTDPEAKSDIEEKNGRKIYRWTLSNAKPREAGSPPQDPVFVVSTLTDWKQVGEWYLSLETPRIEVTPEIKALAAQLTTGKATPRDKLDALYTYVSEQVRYVALEFGIGGYQPHPAVEVLRNRYGDCKDKTGLLQALLEASGIPAYAALANAERGVIEPAVPMPGQFNHVITVVPLDGQLLWMDPTFGVAPLGLLALSMRGKQALLVQPGASHLAEMPRQSPVPERQRLNASGKLDSTGKLTLDDSIELRGTPEVLFRTLFRLGNQQTLSAMTKTVAQAQSPGAMADEPMHSDPLDLAAPFDLKLKVTDTNFFPPLEKSHEVRVPVFGGEAVGWGAEIARAQKQVEAAKKKPGGKTPEPMNLASVGTTETTLDLEIDPSYQVDLPLPVHAERPFASYESTYVMDHGHLKVRRVLQAKADTLEASRWQDIESFKSLVDNDLQQTLQLRRASPVNLESKVSGMSAEEAETAGINALQQGNAFMARTLLVEATKKDPSSKTAWNNLGRADLALGLLDQAEQAFKTQIKINPNDEYAFNNLGQVYYGRRQYEKSIEQFQKQLEINPLDKYAYPGLAAAYELLQRWDDAAQAWSKASAIAHDNATYYISWGHALLKAGKLDEGREKLKRALEIDRNAMTLNNAAYDLADARVDLDQAEQYAHSAVEQAVANLNDANSLEVAKDYNSWLFALSAYTDTLGWIFFQKGQYTDAQPLLIAAHNVRAQSDIAEHLARCAAKLEQPDDALRYYAWSMLEPGWTGRTSPELKQYLEAHFGGPAELARKTAQADAAYFSQHRLPGTASVTWPAGATAAKPVVIQVEALVDEKGMVQETRALAGDEPFRSTALAASKGLMLPPLNAYGKTLKSVRTISFFYSPQKRVTATWTFGNPDERSLQTFQNAEGSQFSPGLLLLSTGQVDEGIAELRAALSVAGSDSPYAAAAHMALGQALGGKSDYEGAVAEMRSAVALSSDDPRPHRLLADMLAMIGSRTAAASEYEEAVRLDPTDADAHFTLGAQLEAAAGDAVKPKVGGTGPVSGKLSKAAADNYQAAYEQYKLAHKLVPEMAAYTEAYERLGKQIGAKP
jgi:tetratricopeptide (TPR) repeat protein